MVKNVRNVRDARNYIENVASLYGITANGNVLGGLLVFEGTQVAVITLLEYMEEELSIDYFLDTYKEVSLLQVKNAFRFLNDIVSYQYIQ